MTATKANYIWAWVFAAIASNILGFILSMLFGLLIFNWPFVIGLPSGIELSTSILICLCALAYYLAFMKVYQRFSYLDYSKATPYIAVLGVLSSIGSFLALNQPSFFGVALIGLLAPILATIFICVDLGKLQGSTN